MPATVQLPRMPSTPTKIVKDTIFVVLPRNLWTPIEGKCSCSVCVQRKSKKAYYDTLAMGRNEEGMTWTVHYPELHS